MIRIFNHFVPKIATLLFLAELVLLLASPYLAGVLRFSDPQYRFVEEIGNFGPSSIAFALSISLWMAALGMYQLSSRRSLQASFRRLPAAIVAGGATATVVFYAFPELHLGRGILVLAAAISGFGVLTLRFVLFRFFRFRMLKSRVIFLGDSALAKECIAQAEVTHFTDRYQVVGIVPLQSGEASGGAPISLDTAQSLVSFARKYNVDEIVISVKNWRGVNIPLNQLLECRLGGVTVTTISRFFEREANQINIQFLQPSWLIFGDGFKQSALRSVAKRTVDILACMLLLIPALPVMLLTAICIVLEDGMPVLYRQERVGRHGRKFTVFKFRSMRTDAEAAGSPQWARVGDTRVTRIGRFIRKTRIDELPQIFNVLMGDMSFVGPRPERPYFVEQLCEQVPYYDMRHSIKPGLTGLAQVRYQYGATVEDAVEKLQYDLYYVKNHSLFLDMLIIIDTVQVVLFAKGSR